MEASLGIFVSSFTLSGVKKPRLKKRTRHLTHELWSRNGSNCYLKMFVGVRLSIEHCPSSYMLICEHALFLWFVKLKTKRMNREWTVQLWCWIWILNSQVRNVTMPTFSCHRKNLINANQIKQITEVFIALH